MTPASTAATASSPTTRSKANGKTSTPPASTTRASTSARARNARRASTSATMEYNALGYSGSNSGGNLVIENSVFRHNTTGIAPNSENPGDGPPPQNGAVQPAAQHAGTPDSRNCRNITTTEIARCTIIRDNLITENNNLDGARRTPPRRPPRGAPGSSSPATTATWSKTTRSPTTRPTACSRSSTPTRSRRQSRTRSTSRTAGNKVSGNTFSGNGYIRRPVRTATVRRRRGVRGRHVRQQKSTNNCLSGNSFADATLPGEHRREVGLPEQDDPERGRRPGCSVEYLLELQAESENRAAIEASRAPPAQPTMPNPCEDVPTNPLCP